MLTDMSSPKYWEEKKPNSQFRTRNAAGSLLPISTTPLPRRITGKTKSECTRVLSNTRLEKSRGEQIHSAYIGQSTAFSFPKPRVLSKRRLNTNKLSFFTTRNQDKVSSQGTSPITLNRRRKSFLPKNQYKDIKQEIKNKNYKQALITIETLLKDFENIKLRYLRGICYLKTGQLQKSLQDFLLIKRSSQFNSPKILINLFKCYKKLKNYKKALKTIEICIEKFPDYLESYYCKGKFSMFKKKFLDAIECFNKTNNIKKYLFIERCWKGLHNYDKAVECLEKFKIDTGDGVFYNVEAGKLEYKFRRYQKAVNFFDNALKVEKCDFEAVYYLSKCKIALGDNEEAELLLEKVAQKTKDDKLATRAVFKISKLKIEQNDFYGAYSTLARKKAEVVALNQKQTLTSIQNHLKKADFLMKKPSDYIFNSNNISMVSRSKYLHEKYAESMFAIVQQHFPEALEHFNSLLSENPPKDLLYKCYIYRAFGYFSLYRIEESYSDYTYAGEIKKLDRSSNFNYKISQALIEYNKKNYSSALEILNIGSFTNYHNPMWHIIRVSCLIINNFSDKNYYNIQSEIESIEELNNDGELLFFQAIIKYLEGNYTSSAEKIEKYFKITDKANILSYVIRAFSYIPLLKYSQAYKDLTSVINMDSDFNNIYPYRSICAYFINCNDEAYEDIKKVSELPDSEATLLSVYLYITTDNIDKALELLSKIEDNDEKFLIQAHCMLIKENFTEAVEILKKTTQENTEIDIKIIEKLLKGQVNIQGTGIIFSEKYTLWIKTIEKIYTLELETAVRNLEDILGNIYTNTKNSLFLHNLIIQEENCGVLYNIAICCILQQTKSSFASALKILSEIATILAKDHRAQIYLLCAIVEVCLDNNQEADKYFKKVKKNAQDLFEKFMNDEDLEILPLKTNEGLSKFIPFIQFPGYSRVNFRPCVPTPKFMPPFEFEDTYDIIIKLLECYKFQIRPEVPWMTKIEKWYKFTDQEFEDTVDCDSNKVTQRDELKSYNKYRYFVRAHLKNVPS
ncbi:hypothetical protein SteCoe_12449 [Stentor coeruleus]|uniref:TPR-like protein n=1 Tax=Stentor coeruleus TaxID=5963 RepID=A0A1R2CAR6_9CILI|nr:hypothetical protein SteCoe_12449 [Stentor coeruleus]